jgi:hypothetical protein
MLIFLNSWSNITFSFIFPPSLTKKKKRKNKLFLYVSVPDADSEWLQGHKHGSVDGIFSVLQRGTLTVWLLFPKSCLCFYLFISFLYTISMAHMIQLQDLYHGKIVNRVLFILHLHVRVHGHGHFITLLLEVGRKYPCLLSQVWSSTLKLSLGFMVKVKFYMWYIMNYLLHKSLNCLAWSCCFATSTLYEF